MKTVQDFKLSEQEIRLELSKLRRKIIELQNALEKSRHEIKQQQSIINIVPALISYIDSSQCCQFDNTGCNKYQGCTVKDILGEAAYLSIQSYISQSLVGKELNFDGQLKLKDGQHHYMRICFRPNIDSHGKVWGCYLLIQDITDQKRVEDERNKALSRFESIAKHVDDCFWSAKFDRVGKYDIDYVSSGWKKIWGYEAEDVCKQSGFWRSTILKKYHKESVKHFEKVWKHKLPHTFVYEIRNKRGEIRWIEDKTLPIVDAANNVIRVEGVARDITAQKNAEQALRNAHADLEKLIKKRTKSLTESNQRLQQEIKQRTEIEKTHERLLLMSPDLICSGDGKYFKTVNPAFKKILGYSEAELLSKPFTEFVHSDDREMSVKKTELLQNGQSLMFLENRYLCKNGQYVWISWNAVVDPENNLIYAIGRDITKQKQLKAALQQSEAQWRSLVRNAPEMIIITNKNCLIEFINYTALDYDEDALIGASIFDYVPDKQRPMFKHRVEQVLSTGKTTSCEILIPNSSRGRIWFGIRLGAIKNESDKLTGLLFFVRDISDTKEVHDQLETRVKERTHALYQSNIELAKTKERLSEAQHIAKIGSWEWNIITNAVWWSEEYYRIFEYDPIKTRPSYEAFIKRVLLEDQHIVREHIAATLEHDKACVFEYRVRLPSGVVHYHRTVGSLERNAEGKPIKLSGTVQDITEKRRAEEALRESERRYRTLTAVAPVGIFHADVYGKNIYTNRAASEIMGLSAKALIGFGWKKNLHPDDKEWVFEKWINSIRKKKAFKYAYRFHHQDGRIVWVLVEAHPELDEQGEVKGYIGTLTDITKRREAEEKLRQHQSELAHLSRLQTAGELVSGIAHELNQPLTAIVHYVGGCLARMQHEHVSGQLIEVMKKVIHQAEFAGAIIHRLKGFLIKRELQKEPVNINELVREAATLLEMSLNVENVTLRLKLTKNLKKISVDKIHIEQVLLVIAHNAIEAMTSDQKRLTIQTVRCKEGGVTIFIRDTGVGISPEDRDVIFQPFYTTKPKGMGIGLAIVSSIIEAHHGRIWVEDNLEDKRGSQFCIYLPATQSI